MGFLIKFHSSLDDLVAYYDFDTKTQLSRRVDRSHPNAQADFDSLIELVESTVHPNSWEAVGGEGSIQVFPKDSTLVISNKSFVHEELESLLHNLRSKSEKEDVESTEDHSNY